MLLKKHKSLCPFVSSKKASQRKKSGEKGSKTFNQNWADTLASSDKGFCFEQKLLALDEVDV